MEKNIVFRQKDIFNDKKVYIGYASAITLTTEMHTHDFFEFFMVLGGGVLHTINGVNSKLFQNDIVLIHPKDNHSFSVIDDLPLEAINIAVSSDIADKILNLFDNNKLFNRIERLSFNESLSIKNACYNLSTNSEIREIAEKLLVINLFSIFALKFCEGNQKNIPNWLEKLTVDFSYPENFTEGIEHLFNSSGYTKEYVCRCFKKYLNKTATQFLNEQRLEYAKVLILTTKMSVLDISTATGFDTLSHFNHLYKKRFLQSPTETRKYRN